MESARSMRLHANLPLQLWAKATNTTFYLIDIAPSNSLDGGILEKPWTGKKVDYLFMKGFCCDTFVCVDKELRTKLESKSEKCVFIGYGVGRFGYHLWDYESNKILKRRDVVFNEIVMYKDHF